jgi:hypothetical protein
MENKFIQLTSTSIGTKMINVSSIALVEDLMNNGVRITLKEIKDGQSISFHFSEWNYQTVRKMVLDLGGLIS